MRIIMLTKWSPVRGQMLQAGQIVEVEPEVAADMIQRGLAQPVKLQVERAVGPAQGRP